jgi:hypothetical protein
VAATARPAPVSQQNPGRAVGHDRDGDGVDDHANTNGNGHDLDRRSESGSSTKPGKGDRHDGVIFVPPLVGLLAGAAGAIRRTIRRR